MHNRVYIYVHVSLFRIPGIETCLTFVSRVSIMLPRAPRPLPSLAASLEMQSSASRVKVPLLTGASPYSFVAVRVTRPPYTTSNECLGYIESPVKAT